jgi:hypothetical protein
MLFIIFFYEFKDKFNSILFKKNDLKTNLNLNFILFYFLNIIYNYFPYYL